MVLALAIEMAAHGVCVVRQASQKTNERRKQGKEQNQRDGEKVEWSGTHQEGGFFCLMSSGNLLMTHGKEFGLCLGVL